MRSTVEIICAVQDRRPVTEEELRLALLAMSGIDYVVERSLRQLAADVVGGRTSIARFRATDAEPLLARMFAARKADPALWLGPAGIPGHPEHDDFHSAALRLLDRVEQLNGPEAVRGSTGDVPPP